MSIPFQSSIKFSLSLRAFGTRAVRVATASYQYVPAWRYFDEAAGAEAGGAPILTFTLQLEQKARSPNITGAHLDANMLSKPMLKELRHQIDCEARVLDRGRRAAAGFPVAPLPEFI